MMPVLALLCVMAAALCWLFDSLYVPANPTPKLFSLGWFFAALGLIIFLAPRLTV